MIYTRELHRNNLLTVQRTRRRRTRAGAFAAGDAESARDAETAKETASHDVLRATSSIDPIATARDGRHILRAGVREEKKPAEAKPPNKTLNRAVEHPSDGFVTKRRADG